VSAVYTGALRRGDEETARRSITRTDGGRRRRGTPGEHGGKGEQVDAAKGQLAPAVRVGRRGSGLALAGLSAHGDRLTRRACLCERDAHHIGRIRRMRPARAKKHVFENEEERESQN
jgi:hypothetical protein